MIKLRLLEEPQPTHAVDVDNPENEYLIYFDTQTEIYKDGTRVESDFEIIN